jgi:hypothetical protein
VPRPGSPSPPRAGAEAEHGATAALQRLAAAVPTRAAPSQTGPGAVLSPAPGRPGPTEQIEPAPLENDLNDGYDRALFGPSQRPDEPITTGVPFGPGANYRPKPFEDDRSFVLRVADELENSPDATALASYIADLRAGR